MVLLSVDVDVDNTDQVVDISTLVCPFLCNPRKLVVPNLVIFNKLSKLKRCITLKLTTGYLHQHRLFRDKSAVLGEKNDLCFETKPAARLSCFSIYTDPAANTWKGAEDQMFACGIVPNKFLSIFRSSENL